MKDILGREIKEGDIVIVKGSGSQYSSGPTKSMEVGIRMGNTIRTLTCCRNPKDKYLIENPCSVELDIKDKILSNLADAKSKANAKALARTKQIANVPGTIYLMSRYDEAFLYMGNVYLRSYKDGNLVFEQKSHLYISLATHIRDKNEYKSIKMSDVKFKVFQRGGLSTFNDDSVGYSFDLLKSHKSYTEILGKVDDFIPELSIEYNCNCTVNGVLPYEKGLYTVSSK